jgi:hypothetical protein
MVARISVLVGGAMIVVFLPTNLDDLLSFATQAAIFAVVGLSLNVIIGYTGQLSLGPQRLRRHRRLHRRLRADRAGRAVRLTFVLARSSPRCSPLPSAWWPCASPACTCR